MDMPALPGALWAMVLISAVLFVAAALGVKALRWLRVASQMAGDRNYQPGAWPGVIAYGVFVMDCWLAATLGASQLAFDFRSVCLARDG